jgi:hypothetical protein
MNELWRLSASEVARLARTRKVSAREVADAALQRLDSVNPRINAIVDCRPDLVREQADWVDSVLARGNDPGSGRRAGHCQDKHRPGRVCHDRWQQAARKPRRQIQQSCRTQSGADRCSAAWA